MKLAKLNKTGFTLIEILMVLAIMTVLIAIGGYQVNLNKKRALYMGYKEDAKKIANVLNDMYQTGNYGSNYVWARKGSYPSIDELNERDPIDEKSLSNRILRAALTASAADDALGRTVLATDFDDENQRYDCSGASETNIQRGGISYYPLTGDDQLCEGSDMECRKVKLFYSSFIKDDKCVIKAIKLESGSVVSDE